MEPQVIPTDLGPHCTLVCSCYLPCVFSLTFPKEGIFLSSPQDFSLGFRWFYINNTHYFLHLFWKSLQLQDHGQSTFFSNLILSWPGQFVRNIVISALLGWIVDGELGRTLEIFCSPPHPLILQFRNCVHRGSWCHTDSWWQSWIWTQPFKCQIKYSFQYTRCLLLLLRLVLFLVKLLHLCF